MNQPMTFMWNNETAEMAKKAGATGGISETGAYEGEIVSAVYTFGKDGSQSQALELSLDSNGLKANFLRINFLGKDGQQTFGMGLVSALMWVAQVKQAQPQQVQAIIIAIGQVAVMQHVTCCTKGHYQPMQTDDLFNRPSHAWVLRQPVESICQRITKLIGGLRALFTQELSQAQDIGTSGWRDDHRWHSGASPSRSVPHPRNQADISLPVTCNPVFS